MTEPELIRFLRGAGDWRKAILIVPAGDEWACRQYGMDFLDVVGVLYRVADEVARQKVLTNEAPEGIQ